MDEEEEDLFVIPDDGDLVINVRKKIAKQEAFITSHKPVKNGELLHKFLGFHLGVLGIDIKIGKDQTSIKTSHSVCPMDINLASLNPRLCLELKIESLQLLLKLFKNTKKSRVFAFWYVLLPNCVFNPCKKGVLELINHTDQQTRERTLDLLMEVFQSSTTHLQLANAHCRAGSFTPVCLEFALALGRMVRCAASCFDLALCEGQPSHVSHASRALVVLFEHLPFHRLENGLLSEVFQRLLKPSSAGPRSNPVILIAVLQVFAVIVSITPSHPEVKSQFDPLYEWFLDLAFPASDLKSVVDNNIRYVSIQNLGLTAILDTGQFLERVPSLHPLLEDAVRSEKDQSVVIHVLRLLKTIGKCGNSMDEVVGIETEKRLLHFWLGVLKPNLMDSVEARECPVLKAALCNCVAEISGTVFCNLPTDRRMLAVTFMLRLCRDADHRTVTASIRGLGMLVSLPTLQNDMAFLTDSAEIMLEIFHRGGGKQAHQSVITSCTWALANLSDSLAKHHLQGEIDDVFPPYLVLDLMRIAITMSFASNNHMNVRSNSVRSLGSLLQCLNAMTKFVSLESFKEVGELCDKAVDAIVVNIETGKVMKVRWNACYASGGVLKTTDVMICSISSRHKLIRALLPVMESCPNYKVRINAALALCSVQDRTIFENELFAVTTLAVVKSLEAAVTNVDDTDEIQHRTDLIDQLCATYAHLMCLTTLEDVYHLEIKLVEYTDDLLSETMRSALLRISPEKTTVFVEAKRHMSEVMLTSNKSTSLCKIFPLGLII